MPSSPSSIPPPPPGSSAVLQKWLFLIYSLLINLTGAAALQNPVLVSQGGTGATTADQARANLGITEIPPSILANTILLADPPDEALWSVYAVNLGGDITTAGILTTAGAFSTAGNFSVTQTYTGDTNVTFPTSGTLATTSQLPTGTSTSYTPTITGFSVNPTLVSRYFLIGKMCTVVIYATANGTSNATTLTITAPFTSVNTANFTTTCVGVGVSNAVDVLSVAQITPNSNVINVYNGLFNGAWDNTGDKSCAFVLTFETA